MFEISELKAKKLPELQEIAKSLNVPKFRSLKKLDLVYQILDYQAANPTKTKEALQEEKAEEKKTEDKPKRPRKKIGSDKKPGRPKKAEEVTSSSEIKKDIPKKESQENTPKPENKAPRKEKESHKSDDNSSKPNITRSV